MGLPRDPIYIDSGYPIYIVDAIGYEKIGFDLNLLNSVNCMALPSPLNPSNIPDGAKMYVIDDDIRKYVKDIFGDKCSDSTGSTDSQFDAYIILARYPRVGKLCYGYDVEFICMRVPDSHELSRSYNDLYLLIYMVETLRIRDHMGARYIPYNMGRPNPDYKNDKLYIRYKKMGLLKDLFKK